MHEEHPAMLRDLGKKEVWSTRDCAQFLNRSEGAIRNLVLRRRVPFRKCGGRLAFLPDEIKLWVQESPGLKLSDMERE